MLPRLAFRRPKVLHPGWVEQVFQVGMPVALPDDLLVD
jgi:hypothetical protein